MPTIPTRKKAAKKKPDEVIETLRPYRFHGMDMDFTKTHGEVSGDCPWCGREGKFSVKCDTGQWRCFVCGEKGNSYTFLRMLWDISSIKGLDKLAESRKFIDTQELEAWGVRMSPLTRDWMMVGHGADGALNQLYRYISMQGKYRLLATPGHKHQLFGFQTYNKRCEQVYICEGPWDGIGLLRAVRASGDTTSSVLAVPGVNVFQPAWAELCAGRRVVLLFDSDHPKDNNGKPVQPAGLTGVKTAASVLASCKNKPAEIVYLNWGAGGYDPSLPSGTDVRDILYA